MMATVGTMATMGTADRQQLAGWSERALLWVESMLDNRRATLSVRHSPPGFHVQYIRWRDRGDARVIWTSVYSDTSVTVTAAAYRFRYRDSQTGRDTVVDVPCADGCRVPVAR
jgi:hypothetical protein